MIHIKHYSLKCEAIYKDLQPTCKQSYEIKILFKWGMLKHKLQGEKIKLKKG